jgi:hypothetical protein
MQLLPYSDLTNSKKFLPYILMRIANRHLARIVCENLIHQSQAS